MGDVRQCRVHSASCRTGLRVQGLTGLNRDTNRIVKGRPWQLPREGIQGRAAAESYDTYIYIYTHIHIS